MIRVKISFKDIKPTTFRRQAAYHNVIVETVGINTRIIKGNICDIINFANNLGKSGMKINCSSYTVTPY